MSNRLLGIGGSSIVTAENDGKTVLKGYEAWDGDQLLALREENGCEKLLAKEDHVYRVLGEHPHILRCYGLVEVHPNVRSLRLERALYGNIREFIRNNKTTPLSEESRLNIALGVSSGIAYMHSKNIIHCNISCRNLLLFPDLRVKVCDFGSARIDENLFENYIVEEIRYELPLRGRVFEDCLYIKRKLFALGSTVYEIMAWGMPSEELGTDDVEKKYAAEEFPDVTFSDIRPASSRCLGISRHIELERLPVYLRETLHFTMLKRWRTVGRALPGDFCTSKTCLFSYTLNAARLQDPKGYSPLCYSPLLSCDRQNLFEFRST